MKKRICVILAIIIGITMMPVFSNATTTAKPAKVSLNVVNDGHLKVGWSAVSSAMGYIVYIKNITKGTCKSFSVGKTTSYTIKDISCLTHKCYFSIGVRNKDSRSIRWLSTSKKYIEPSKLYSSHSFLTINKGKTRKLRVTFKTKHLDTDSYNSSLIGRWTSSDTSVATVSQDGTVKAISQGSAKITYRTINGLSKSTTVTVPKSETISGSMYISNGQHNSWHTILGATSIRSGAKNRLNGTVVSDYRLKTIYVKIYSGAGKRLENYKKRTSAYSYNLTKISKNVNFDDLRNGIYVVKVVVKSTKGMKTLYTHSLKVTSKPSYSKRGAKIVQMALTRQGDPYSQWLRGLSNYTDCSYLTRWSYKQVANVSLPGTAAGQYKYCVKKNKRVSKANRRTGDLVFWGGKRNGRYKGIWHTAVYMGNNIIVHANGTKTVVDTIESDKRYTIYYGRPY